MRKQPEITEKTRNTFICVFCDLYRVKPIEKITVQELTRIAGYNRSTFYQYYNDIYELRDQLENDIFEYMRRNAAKIQEPRNVNVFIQNIARLFQDKEKYMVALLSENGSFNFTEKLKKNMIEITSSKDVLSNDNPLLPYLMECFISTIITVFRCWQYNGKDISFDAYVNLLHDILTEGILRQMQKIEPHPSLSSKIE